MQEVEKYHAFHPQSKVWIYQANRFLAEQEIQDITLLCQNFVKQWEAHGKPLDADFYIFYGLFIVFFVNAQHENASGCSIDKQVALIKFIEEKYSLILTDRLLVAFTTREHNNIKILKHTQLLQAIQDNKISKNIYIFDNSLHTLQDFKKSWKIPITESWLKNYLT